MAVSIFTDQFWKAPELLRDSCLSIRGTQKGDIYAFAIILYEILGRHGPFGIHNMEPKGIVWLLTILYSFMEKL